MGTVILVILALLSGIVAMAGSGLSETEPQKDHVMWFSIGLGGVVACVIFAFWAGTLA